MGYEPPPRRRRRLAVSPRLRRRRELRSRPRSGSNPHPTHKLAGHADNGPGASPIGVRGQLRARSTSNSVDGSAVVVDGAVLLLDDVRERLRRSRQGRCGEPWGRWKVRNPRHGDAISRKVRVGRHDCCCSVVDGRRSTSTIRRASSPPSRANTDAAAAAVVVGDGTVVGRPTAKTTIVTRRPAARARRKEAGGEGRTGRTTHRHPAGASSSNPARASASPRRRAPRAATASR